MKIELSLEKLNNLDSYNEYMSKFITHNLHSEVLAPAGREHYRLIYYLSSLFNNINIYDLGTSFGHSSVACSVNKTNTVKSIDIINIRKLKNENELNNVYYEFIPNLIGNFELLSSPFIILDVGDHDGVYETQLINWLISENYNGIILIDDYGDYFPGIKHMVNNLYNDFKIDVTKYGHFTGTALLNFTKNYNFILK